MPSVDQLEALLAAGQDSVVLRFALGAAYLDEQDAATAAAHLEAALGHDPDYSAAWKLLGKARAACGDDAGALQAWDNGIAAAARRGDKQAEREMSVFVNRLRKRSS